MSNVGGWATVGDISKLLRLLLHIGGVERHPGPPQDGKNFKLTSWNRDAYQWVFDYAAVIREDADFEGACRVLVKLFAPGSPGSKMVLKVVTKLGNDRLLLTAVELRNQYRAHLPAGHRDAEVNDVVMLHILQSVLFHKLPADSTTDRDRLRQVVRKKGERMDVFLERFLTEVEECPGVDLVEKKRILYARLPRVLQDAVSGCDVGCTMDVMFAAIRTKMHWEGILEWEAPQKSEAAGQVWKSPYDGQPMDLDRFNADNDIQLCGLRDKLIGSTGNILYSAINSENGVMVAWKQLMKNATYKKEAERYLRGPGVGVKSEGRRQVRRAMAHALDSVSDEDPGDGDFEQAQWASMDAIDGDTGIPVEWAVGREGVDAGGDAEPSHWGMTTVEPVLCRTVKGKGHPSSLSLPVSLGETTVSGLVDTGATHNFIQLTLLKKLGMQQLIRPCNRKVVYGNGAHDAVEGLIDLPVCINGQATVIPAYIIQGKGPQIVLGYSFLANHDLLVDCKHRRLLSRDANGGFLQCAMHSVSPVTAGTETHGSEDLPRLHSIQQQLALMQSQLVSLLAQKN